MTSSPKITLVLADDHPLVRDSLSFFLAKEPDFEVVATCADSDGFGEQVRSLRPAVALTDIEMPGTSVFKVLRDLRRDGSTTRFLLISAYLSDAYLAEALDLGVYSYLLKSTTVAEIGNAVRQAAAGKSCFSPAAAARVTQIRPLTQPRSTRQSPPSLLTAREREVLRLVASDLSGKEIAGRLGLSARTVDRHKANMMEKLGIHSQVGLTRYALAEGVCDARHLPLTEGGAARGRLS